MRSNFERLNHDAGAVAAEYALVASLIAVVIAGAVTVFGQAVLRLFQLWPHL